MLIVEKENGVGYSYFLIGLGLGILGFFSFSYSNEKIGFDPNHVPAQALNLGIGLIGAGALSRLEAEKIGKFLPNQQVLIQLGKILIESGKQSK